MPERGKIQDVYLHPNRNAKDISRELNMDKGLLSRILKAGFKKIEKEELPIEYDYPYDDSDFFCLTLNGYQ